MARMERGRSERMQAAIAPQCGSRAGHEELTQHSMVQYTTGTELLEQGRSNYGPFTISGYGPVSRR